MSDTHANERADDERKRRVRRSVWLLSLLAAAFYVGFILLTWLRNRP
ncbi:MAG: hypothetical protein H7Y02_13010 [Candidatus Obscuribacterales bacterium]|nr:hypothetical protein [Steroidobacteraceae bacterium]